MTYDLSPWSSLEVRRDPKDYNRNALTFNID